MNSDFTSKDTILWSSGICIVLQIYYNVSVKFVNFLLLVTKNYIHYTCWPTSFIRNMYKGLITAVFCFIYTYVDECAEQMDNCHVDANCINTEGNFQCQCKDGFMGSDISCTGTIVIFLEVVNCTIFSPLLTHQTKKWIQVCSLQICRKFI